MSMRILKGTSKNYPSAALDKKFSRSTYLKVRLPPEFFIRLASGQVFRGALKTIFFLVVVCCVTACFGGADMRGSVESYKQGTVYTKGGQFQVGKLSPPWVQKKFKYRALLFTHPDYQAAIGVDAFCKGSFDDGPLPILTNQLFYGMKAVRTRDVSRVVLDDREARRTIIDASLDGASLTADVVVLKMHQCIFDFFYIAKPATYAKGVHDFEDFYSGFHYVSGPPIDD